MVNNASYFPANPIARVQRIYGGINEIMKEVITRAMGLGGK